MDQLNQLYDTPLEEFFRLSSNNGAAATGEFHSLQRCILQAKSALPPSMEYGELTTIKDVLALAYQLCPAGSKNEQAITLCRQLLVALCAPVVDRNVPPQNSYSGRHVQSLSKRLEVISGSYLPMYQLFFMPCIQYYYGLCCVTNSMYPQLIYEERLRRCLDTDKKDRVKGCSQKGFL